MPPLQQTFYLSRSESGEWVHAGEAPRGEIFIHGQLQWPRSLAFFCAQCGRFWARMPVENQPWSVLMNPCENCQPWIDHPAGSLWIDWDKDYLRALPRSLLLREFALHLNHFKKDIEPCEANSNSSSTSFPPTP